MSGFQSKKAMALDKLTPTDTLDEVTREEIVQYLTDSDFEYILHEDGGPELLGSYLELGFKGYRNYTDMELIVEYQQRKEME